MNRYFSLLILGILILSSKLTPAQDINTFELDGGWKFRRAGTKDWFPAKVPGTVHLDLMRNNLIPDPYSRDNESKLQWIGEVGWEYVKTFQYAENNFAWRHIELVSKGLDTYANIYLNDSLILVANNMFREWFVDIKRNLRIGTNTLRIQFPAVIPENKAEYAKLPYKLPGDEKVVCRKAAYHFGWDWGPIVPDVGIWRAIRLVRYDEARIDDLHILQHHQASTVELEIKLKLAWWSGSAWQSERPDSGIAGKVVEAIAGVFGAGGAPLVRAILHHPDGNRQEMAITDGLARLRVDKPQLWWPNGLGTQPLYRLEVLVQQGHKVLDRQELTIGLRTLRLRQEPDAWGESFEFEVNGQSFFASGADYIPEDIALARVGRAQTERLIRDSAAANFNCLRVWGGGVYPSDDFYDLCDRYGLVVWEDLMFACALYDIKNPDFRADILEEVRDNVRRLRHHASLGLICGNNEMEVALVEWGLPDVPATKTEYLLQYQHLFPQIMAEEAPEISYWPASPSSGGDFANPNAPERGDCHFWEVWHGNKDFSEYSKHYFRFMSEFGFESFPALKTIESFSEPGDRDILSPVMEDHQRCVGGNAKITAYMNRYFRSPADFAATIYLSWLSQAEAIRHGIEHWRRHRGRCMGSVYWQLNDNWPVASWSSIDNKGRWKALHYQARRSYAPLLLSSVTPDPETLDAVAQERYKTLPKPIGNGHYSPVPALVELHLSNESFQATTATIYWELLTTDGTVIDGGQVPCAVNAFSSTIARELDLSARVNGRETPRHSLLSYRAELADGQVLHGFHHFVPFKQLALPVVQVQTRVRAFNPERDRITGIAAGSVEPAWVIELSADRPALFVAVDHDSLDLVLSDNYVFLDGQRVRSLVVERICRDGLEIQLNADELSMVFASDIWPHH